MRGECPGIAVQQLFPQATELGDKVYLHIRFAGFTYWP